MNAPPEPADRDDAVAYGLEMPFVSVASKGGPHEDGAYVAGWEMGALDVELRCLRPAVLDRTIRTDNAAQADLVAMKHGYRARTEPTEFEEWTYLRLESTAEAGGVL